MKMENNINLELYKIFYYVAKLGSVTNAAKCLCLSQPAISQSLKQLEDNVGTALFIRRSKGVELTAEGKVFYEYVKNGYEQIKYGEKKLQEMLDLEFGEICIGASDMTLQYYLLPYLEKFHQLYPNIKVNVTNAPTPRTIEHLDAGRIDFGVVSSPFEIGEQYEVHHGKQIQDVFVAGERFKELEGKTLEYCELLNYPLICLEKNTSTRKYIDEFLRENNVSLNPEFELATSSIVTQFAVRNLGIGCVVEDFAHDELKAGKLFKLKFQRDIPKREMCVISKKSAPVSKAALALLSLM